MGELALVRVDGRLIHGATCMVWGSAISASRIIAVDNVIAKNAFVKKITEAVSKNVPAVVVTEEEIVNMWKKDQFGDGRIMVIFKTIESALAVRKLGFDFPKLQIGLTLMKNGSQHLSRTLFINQSEMDALTELDETYHVEIYTQYSPQLPAEPWTVSIKSKYKGE